MDRSRVGNVGKTVLRRIDFVLRKVACYILISAKTRIEATVPENLVRQIEAIKLQQTWSIWLVTAQLAILGAIANAIFQPGYKTPCHRTAISLLIGMCFSCLSIIAASVLASAHPSMLLRIKETREDLNLKLWDFKYCPSALVVAIIEHYAFVIAIACYGLYLGIRIFHP